MNIDLLIKQTKGPNYKERRRALRELKRILKESRYRRNKAYLLHVLSRVVPALKEENIPLVRIVNLILRLLLEEWAFNHDQNWAVFAKFSDLHAKIRRMMVRALKRRGTTEKQKVVLIRLLSMFGGKSRSADRTLVGLLENGNAIIREPAAKTLGIIGWTTAANLIGVPSLPVYRK